MKRMLMFGTLLALLSPQVVNAQVKSSYPYKNNVKLNTLGLVLHNVSFIYERHLNEHWALLAGSGFRWGGDIPKVFGLGDLIVSSNTRGLRGYSFTPELRHYFKFCECGAAPSGLYAGFYTRYTRLYGNLNFHYWTGDEFIDVVVASKFNEIGAGIQLGYQFIFKERFTVDFMFAGPRLSSNRLGFSFNSEYAEELAPIIEEEINKRLEWLGKDPISISPSGEIETRFGFRYFRYAVAFGFMF
jgi:Protein of unknown function (DUF3575)